MSMVNDGQKKAMGDILRAMNSALTAAPSPVTTGEHSLCEASPVPYVESTAISTAVGSTDDAKVNAMKDIMSRFRNATDNVREHAHTNENLMEALQTERTATGVRISEWEITISEKEGRPGKFYNVIRDDINIATNLRLYEAALLLTRELNRGSSITSGSVKEILRLEEEFAKNLEDAARFARIAKTATGEKAVIAEARLSDARSKAISAKEQIKRVR